MSPPADRYCVVDAQVIGLANGRSTGPAARDRLKLLMAIARGLAVPVKNPRLLHDYARLLANKPLNDIVRAFIQAFDKYGLANDKGLAAREIEHLRHCRFPAHDDYLLKAAKDIEGAVVATEESALMATSSCVYARLKWMILSPAETLKRWRL